MRLAGFVPVLLIVALIPTLPAGAAQEDAPWSIEDDSGDQAFTDGVSGVAAAPLPPAGTHPHTDLKRITIEGESELGFFVNFFVGPFSYQPAEIFSWSYQCRSFSASSSSGLALANLETATMQLDFELVGGPATYSLKVNMVGTRSGAEVVVTHAYGYLCLDAVPPARGSLLQDVTVTLDPEAEAIRAWIPKTSLLGVGGSTNGFSFGSRDDAARPAMLNAGDRFAAFTATSASYASVVFLGEFGPSVHDRAPNEGEAAEYVLRHSAANQRIVAKIGNENGIVAVAAGQNQSVPFALANKGDAKRIVKLSYALEGADAAGYVVTGPPTATIPPGSKVNLTLALLSPASGPLEPDVRVSVRADAVGVASEVGHSSAHVVPSPVLGPGANVLHLHGVFDGQDDVLGTAICTAANSLFCSGTFLSPHAEDPRATDPDLASMVVFPSDRGDSFDGFVRPAWQASPLPIPVAFGAEPILIELKLRAPSNIENVRLRAMLAYGLDGHDPTGTLGEATATGTVTSEGTVFSMLAPVQILDAIPLLPAGSEIGLFLDAVIPASAGAAAAAASGGIEIVGGESKITLPLVELPADQRADARASPFQLVPVGDRTGYVNPGEARLFNVTLLNQGNEPREALLTLDVQPPTWSAEVLPGHEFMLQPGDTLRLGVLLHAPADAKEGEQATVWVNATSGESAPASLKLTTLATGLDLPNDATAFKADEDAESRLLSNKKSDTPGPGTLALLVAALGMVLLRRRLAP